MPAVEVLLGRIFTFSLPPARTVAHSKVGFMTISMYSHSAFPRNRGVPTVNTNQFIVFLASKKYVELCY